jgi:hypothetical protein
MTAAVLICAVGVPRSAHAQQAGEQPDKASVTALLDELDDIDVGRYVTPLKLTGEQIDKLAAAITEANSGYDKKVAELRAASVGKLAEEIHKRHKETIAGAPASKEFDTKVQAMMTAFNSQKEKVYADGLVVITTNCGKILTSDQKKIAAQMEKDMFFKLGKKMNPSNTDDQYFNQYVVDIFIGYHRILALLKEIKSAG